MWADKDVDFHFQDWPLIWTGYVNSRDVKIIQSKYSDDFEDYSFIPHLNDNDEGKIISAIDSKLKTILD